MKRTTVEKHITLNLPQRFTVQMQLFTMLSEIVKGNRPNSMSRIKRISSIIINRTNNQHWSCNQYTQTRRITKSSKPIACLISDKEK